MNRLARYNTYTKKFAKQELGIVGIPNQNLLVIIDKVR